MGIKNEEISKDKELNYISKLNHGIGNDLSSLKGSTDRMIDPSFTKEIGLKIETTVEKIRDLHISGGIKDAYGRLSYMLEKEDLPKEERFVELSKVIQVLKDESSAENISSSEINSKKQEMLNEIIEKVEREFDPQNAEKNDSSKMQNVAHKLFLDVSKIRDLYLPNKLKDVLERGKFFEKNYKSMPKADVELELEKIATKIRE